MTITYTVAIDRDHDGLFAEPGATGEVITPDVLRIDWHSGMNHPEDVIAEVGEARVTVRNSGGAFSPERGGVTVGARLRILSHDGTTQRVHFTGTVTRIEPAPGDQGARQAVIVAQDVGRDLQHSVLVPPVLVDVTAADAIRAVLAQASTRRAALAGFALIDDPASLIDSVTLFAAEAFAVDLDTGRGRFITWGDAWRDGTTAYAALEDIAFNERGHLFFDAEGRVIFRDRHALMVDQRPLAAIFSDDMDGLRYAYGDTLVNEAAVTVTPRRVGQPDSLLWALPDVQSLPPGMLRRITARFRDTNGDPVGAVDLQTPQIVASDAPTGGRDRSGQVVVTLRGSGTTSAVIELRNDGDELLYVQALTLFGTPVHDANPVTVTVDDADSRTRYGPSSRRLTLTLLHDVEQAEAIAAYLVRQGSDPAGVVRDLHAGTRTHPTATLALTLLDRVQIHETQTGHSADYHIMAAHHSVDRGGFRHRVRWLLRPADPTDYVMIDSSRPNTGAMIVPY